MAGGAGKILEVRDGLVLYNASTPSGSSGAPVMKTDSLVMVCAVHVRGNRRLRANVGPEMTDEVVGSIERWIRTLPAG